MNENNYERIIEVVHGLAQFVKMDANTFIWAKSQGNFIAEKKEKEGTIYDLGGGNLYIVLASLSFYSFLSKVYEIVATKEELGKLFKKDNKTGKTTNIYKDESKAVGLLTEKINANFRFIENLSEIQDFWKLMRHGLVHCFLPKGPHSTISAIPPSQFATDNLNYCEYLQILKSSTNYAVARNADGGFDVNSDLLAEKVMQISDWLTGELKDSTFNKRKHDYIMLLFSAV